MAKKTYHVFNIEDDLDGPSYTWDTVQAENTPDAALLYMTANDDEDLKEREELLGRKPTIGDLVDSVDTVSGSKCAGVLWLQRDDQELFIGPTEESVALAYCHSLADGEAGEYVDSLG